MKKNKYIKAISENLPIVYEQTVSGFYMEGDEPKPNFVNHPINHERRLRKAYQSLGVEGIKQYLNYIHELQVSRSENALSEVTNNT